MLTARGLVQKKTPGIVNFLYYETQFHWGHVLVQGNVEIQVLGKRRTKGDGSCQCCTCTAVTTGTGKTWVTQS